MTYAILVHQLLDINVVIRKSLVYSVLAATIAGTYFTGILLAEKGLRDIVGYRSLVGSVVAGFAIALGFNPLKEFLQQFVDTYFFHGTQAVLAAENERLRQEVARTEKLRAVSTLAAGMAHEIKNPLSAIKTFVEYLPKKYDDPAYRTKFTRILQQEVAKMNHMVERLLDFAKPSRPQKAPVRFSVLAKEVLELVQASIVERQVSVEMDFAYDDEVSVDPEQMKQVILNLVLNGIEAIDPPGRLALTSARENGHVELRIQDTGRGISKRDLARIFDPFFTTKPAGTGLGLSVVHNIVQEHGGRVLVNSQLGVGTTVRVLLPTNGRSHGEATHSHRG